MRDLPKLQKFETPEGYFEQLPDQILGSIKQSQRNTWIGYAATIALIISASTLIWMNSSPQPEQLSLDEEVELYINSQYWTAEDVLSMAENPNELLDQIINEEYPKNSELWGEEDQTWF